MQAIFSARFQKSYREAPERIKKDFDKQITFLLRNFRHPSLHTKKYNEAQDVWQARVNRNWRCYFKIRGETYDFIDIMLHPK